MPLAPRNEPLPFLVKLIVCFLAADALERCGVLAQWGLEAAKASELTGSDFDVGGPLGLLAIGISVMLEVILILLVLLRTWWGRLWTQALFLIHLVYAAHLVLIAKPELWVFLDTPGRLRIGGTLVLDALILAYLWSPEVRDTLDR
ncbi:MAG: hypothetical protein JKY65_33110 [Planctomycetes bacterium]|nr:hypothetical protein [Planctomycetota bacterium]